MSYLGDINNRFYCTGDRSLIYFTFVNTRLRGVELPEEEEEDSPGGATGSSAKQFSPPDVTEMFMVNGNTQDFFKRLGYT